MSLPLNQIAENIAYKLGEQFNYTLKESIKLTLINWRAKYLKDSLSKDNFNYNSYTQTVTIDLIETDVISEFGSSICNKNIFCRDKISNKYKVLKTKTTLPTPLRRRGRGRSLYNYFGSVNHSKPFSFTTFDEIEYRSCLPYQNKVLYYTVVNNYGYVLGSLDICDILINDLFENPRDAYKKCNNNKFLDDNNFPIPVDMLQSIENSIVRGEYPLIKDGQETNIQKDDRD